MKRTFRQLLLTAAAVLCSTLTTWAEPYNGTPQTPAKITADNYGIYGFAEDNWSAFNGYYAITSAAELYGFAELVNGGANAAKAVLTANIEVNKNVLNDDGTLNGTPTYSWTPIGTSSKKYAGIFDGNGHTISGLYFNNTTDSNYPNGGKNVGLIGYTNGATIKNVEVVDLYFKGYSSVGGICGVGYDSRTNITNCYNTGTVLGSYYVGGICGHSGTQTNCYNTGTVSCSNNYVGGICGCYGTQTNCYNTGTVSGSQNVGGICGGNSNQTNCYNIGTVSGSSNVDGICGSIGTQTNCYYLAGCCLTCDGGISATAEEFASGRITYLLNGSTSEGELAWYQTIDGTDALPTLDSSHGTVYAEAPCMTGVFSNTYLAPKNHDWDSFGQCKDCGAMQSATLITAENYSGLGFTDDYVGWYAISNAAQLYWFANEVNNGSTTIKAVLTADIVVNENVLNDDGTLNGTPTYSWTPIGTRSKIYAGTFDGNGHTISGLYYDNTTDSDYPNGGKYVGLIGYADEATIKNVGVIGSYIRGYSNVGCICGYSSSTNTNITNCYNTGTVSCSYSYVGGICGQSGTQTNCYNTGTVSGSYDVGGICGWSGTQNNCYYLAGCGSQNTRGFSVTAVDVASGRLTYLLNGSTSGNDNAWRQTLGVGGDAYPVLDNTHAVVYATLPCISFSNDVNNTHKEHPSTDDVTRYCTTCGQFAAQGSLVTESNYNALNLTADFVGYYTISNAAELYWFADVANHGNTTIKAVLTADIVVNENVLNNDGTLNATPTYSWTPIGTSSYYYAGTFDGNGHTISGLYFNNTTNSYYPDGGTHVGLIGIAKGATIKNVGVIDSYINGHDYVGGICGRCNDSNTTTTITNCYNTGTVSGSEGVGGICGVAGTQTNCHNSGKVYGSYRYIGGICGGAGTITNCYNTGTVSGRMYRGGICGSSGIITNCYNTGTVGTSSGSVYAGSICGYSGTITNCYYLAGSCSLGDGGVSATAEEFASGKIGYLLNRDNNNAWYQDLYSDEYPLLDNTHNLVSGYIEEDGDTYTVVGDMFLATNYEVAEGKTLSVPAGTTLTTTGNAVITNNGTLRANGTLAGNNLAGNGTFVTNRLSLCNISNLSESYVYKGTAYTLEDGLSGVAVSTTILGKSFTLDASYSAPVYTNNSNVGTATITWTNTSDANDVLRGEFEITPKEVELVWGETTFTYNGEAQAPTATATGMVNNESLTVTVSGEQTNANTGTETYTATASITDNNYKLPEVNTKEFTIGKATPTFTAPENLSIKCNETLADIALSAGFAFENLNVELTDGENTLTIKFTPENTDNYQVVEGIEVKVVKASHTAVPDAAVPATCTESGLTEGSHCSICNEVLVAQEVIPASHKADSVVFENMVAATCTVAGSYDSVVYCSVCKVELSRDKKVVAALGHKADSVLFENIVSSTCTIAGSYDSVVYCSVCHVEISRDSISVPANGHKADSVAFENIVAATCTVAGSKDSVVYCSVCKAEVSRTKIVIPAHGHTVVVDSAVAATATTDGLTEGSHCSVCGETIVPQEVIPATGEQGGNNQGGNENNGGNENQGGENTEPATAVAESAAQAVNIYATGNTIVVENATDEIFVYNVMGGLVVRGTDTTITVSHTGVYIVKTGNTAKRVMIY